MPMHEPLSYPDEVWKPVVDPRFPGLEASSIGRIRRLPTKSKPLRLATIWRGGRYLVVRVRTADGSYSGVEVHYLVCCAFHGPRPTAQHHAAHRNGIPHDVHEDNLRWATPRENAADASRHGALPHGEQHCGSILTEKQVVAIRGAIAAGQSSISQARAYNVSKTTIRDIKRRSTWAHVT